MEIIIAPNPVLVKSSRPITNINQDIQELLLLKLAKIKPSLLLKFLREKPKSLLIPPLLIIRKKNNIFTWPKTKTTPIRTITPSLS